MYQVKLEKFEGPLDLLLQLIEQQELEITEVSLAAVADQYINYLNKSQEFKTEELADFLVVAAKLLYLKSQALLPNLDLGEGEEASDLERQLKIYKEYFQASHRIHQLILKRNFSFARERLVRSEEIIFNPPRTLDQTKLKNIFEEIIEGLKPIFELPRRALERTISIQEKISYIRNVLLSCIENKLCFKNILKNVKSKTEIIVSFLALLELVKQRAIVATQEGIFEEITIKKHEPNI